MRWTVGASQPVSKVAPPLCLPRGASVTVAAFPERARGAETQLIEFTSHCSVFAPENRPRLLSAGGTRVAAFAAWGIKLRWMPVC